MEATLVGLRGPERDKDTENEEDEVREEVRAQIEPQVRPERLAPICLKFGTKGITNGIAVTGRQFVGDMRG